MIHVESGSLHLEPFKLPLRCVDNTPSASSNPNYREDNGGYNTMGSFLAQC